MKNRISTRKLIAMSMLAAISTLLMFLEMPIPFMPPFLKLDISAVPIMVGSFLFGPIEGVVMALLKSLIHLLSTQTAGVGELADFLITGSFALTAGLVYRIKHSRAGALISCVASIAVITIVGALANYFLLLPFYASAYMPYDAIIAACQAINPAITDIKGYILFGVVPFNLLKGTVVAIITFAVYKRLSGVFHRWMEASQPRKA
ncbi:MAG TPA: ECF transporter S component [Candidatus Anaerofilum excrementigallinarum]|nr:ECF transporter S component [Candidatus Anaerofilum excrementigallinarum]